MFTIKSCLMDNDKPETRIFDIRKKVVPEEFVNGPTSRYDNMYTYVRAAMIKYGLPCTQELPAGSPIWKKLTAYIWPDEVMEICALRERGAARATSGIPGPPRYPSQVEDEPGEDRVEKETDRADTEGGSRSEVGSRDRKTTVEDVDEDQVDLIEALIGQFKVLMKSQKEELASEIRQLRKQIEQQGQQRDPHQRPNFRDDGIERDDPTVKPRDRNDEDRYPIEAPEPCYRNKRNDGKPGAHTTQTVKSTYQYKDVNDEEQNPPTPATPAQPKVRNVRRAARSVEKSWTPSGEMTPTECIHDDEDERALNARVRFENDEQFVFKREGSMYIDDVLNDADAPNYKHQTAQELKRKQDGVKAVMAAFSNQNDKFGGGREDDWNKHIEEYETIILDYQLRSKDMAFYLRLTLKDQALAVHRAEFPLKVKTYPKLCRVLEQRFDTRSKRDTNSKALRRLDFSEFLKDAKGSQTRAFNNLVLRIEKLSTVAEVEDSSEKARISNLMKAIEKTPWFLMATAGTDELRTFTEVVQKVNLALSKQVLNNPSFDAVESGSKTDDAVKPGVLFAAGNNMEQGDEELYEQERRAGTTAEVGDGQKVFVSEMAEQIANIMFEGQRRYGRYPHKLHSGNFHKGDRQQREDYVQRGYMYAPPQYRPPSTSGEGRRYGTDDRRDSSFEAGAGKGREDDMNHSNNRGDGNNERGLPERCFNCGVVNCRISSFPEPRN